jgi:hypothetical protein
MSAGTLAGALATPFQGRRMVMHSVNDRSKTAKKPTESSENGRGAGEGCEDRPPKRGEPGGSGGLNALEQNVALPPPLAIRVDGALMLSVEHLAGRSFEKREVWSGVVLYPWEVAEVLKRADNCAQETAARIVGEPFKKSSKG